MVYDAHSSGLFLNSKYNNSSSPSAFVGQLVIYMIQYYQTTRYSIPLSSRRFQLIHLYSYPMRCDAVSEELGLPA